MDFIGLDSNFNLVRYLNCINIQWNRRYYEAGDYEIEMRAADWDNSIKYVFTSTRPELGMVEKIETQHTIKGDFVLVSGFFLEGMLNWKITIPKQKSTGNISAACKTLVSARMYDTIITVPDEPNLGTADSFESEGEYLGDATYAALKDQELSQRIRFDYSTKELLYEIWQGLDRTNEQTDRTYATFSQSNGNLDELKLTLDSSGYRNYANAFYTDLDGVRQRVNVDMRESEDDVRRILYVDTGIVQEEGDSTATVEASVTAEARKQLADYPNMVNIDSSVLQSNLFYLTDYDLGDKCDIRDDRLGLTYQTRIIEVNEVWKNNEHTVSLQFGDKIPVSY